MHQLDLFTAGPLFTASPAPVIPTRYERQPGELEERAAEESIAEAEAEAETIDADQLMARCIELGLAPNEFLFGLNGVYVTHDFPLEGIWALPSRLFRHPFELGKGRYADDGQSRLLLRSPLLKAHPFVQHVEQLLGIDFTGTEPDEFGRDVGALGRWWHAVDLIEKHPDALLETRQFTTDEDIAKAVGFAVHHKGMSLPEARRVLRAIGAAEPADRSRAALMGAGICAPSACEERDGKGKVKSRSWPINRTRELDGPAEAWAMIHGLEDGWFQYRGDFANWSETGRARRAGEAAELL